MAAKSEGWHVGARVFVVETRHGSREPLTYWAMIIKVGRKWVTVQREGSVACCRFDAETMRVDYGDYPSRARIYVSEDDYLQETERRKEWRDLLPWVGYSGPPPHMTLEDIRAVAKMVKGEEG